MKVPEVVKIAMTISTHMATDGPESQSHQVSPSGAPPARNGGADVTPNAPSRLCRIPDPLWIEKRVGPLRLDCS